MYLLPRLARLKNTGRSFFRAWYFRLRVSTTIVDSIGFGPELTARRAFRRQDFRSAINPASRCGPDQGCRRIRLGREG